MIGERRAAQSREQNLQPTFPSLLAYSFRYVSLPPLSQVSEELRILAPLLGNGE